MTVLQLRNDRMKPVIPFQKHDIHNDARDIDLCLSGDADENAQ